MNDEVAIIILSSPTIRNYYHLSTEYRSALNLAILRIKQSMNYQFPLYGEKPDPLTLERTEQQAPP